MATIFGPKPIALRIVWWQENCWLKLNNNWQTSWSVHYHVWSFRQFHYFGFGANIVFGMWKTVGMHRQKARVYFYYNRFLYIPIYWRLCCDQMRHSFFFACENQFCSNAYRNNALHEAHKNVMLIYLSLFEKLYILYSAVCAHCIGKSYKSYKAQSAKRFKWE